MQEMTIPINIVTSNFVTFLYFSLLMAWRQLKRESRIVFHDNYD